MATVEASPAATTRPPSANGSRAARQRGRRLTMPAAALIVVGLGERRGADGSATASCAGGGATVSCAGGVSGSATAGGPGEAGGGLDGRSAGTGEDGARTALGRSFVVLIEKRSFRVGVDGTDNVAA